MIGFDWPFQFASWSSGMGRARELLIRMPATLGRFSFALRMHNLLGSPAAKPGAADTARTNTEQTAFMRYPLKALFNGKR